MAASVLVWVFGFGIGYIWIAFRTINPFALNGLWIPPLLFGGAAFLLDFVLALALLAGFDKLFDRVSRR